MSDLTLPGTIPGLLRRGSPCFIGTGPNRDAATVSQIIDAHGAEVTTVRREPRKRVSFCYTFQSLHLDLTDATGRAHAAWWLAEAFGMSNPCATVWTRRGYGWTLWDPADPDHNADREIPSLAELDATDDRRLPDGSRQVDAEALRRVVLHVAGVPHV